MRTGLSGMTRQEHMKDSVSQCGQALLLLTAVLGGL